MANGIRWSDFVTNRAIANNTGVNFCKKFKVQYFTIFCEFLMATELHVFELVRVTVNERHMRIRVSLV